MINHIDFVKERIINLYPDVCESMIAWGKTIDQCRMRVLTFHSSAKLHQDTIVATDFFKLPEDRETFSKHVQNIQVNQGSNALQNGLECVAEAIRSNWNDSLPYKRQIIIVWSNTGTKELKDTRNLESSAPGAANDFDDLSSLWDERSRWCHNAFLTLYTPDVPDWSRLSNEWNNVIHFVRGPGQELDERTYHQIMNAVLHGQTIKD
jgi:hypothetical protein